MKRTAVFGLVMAVLGGCSSTSYVETSAGLSEQVFDRIAASRSRLALALKYIEIGNYQDAKINLEKAKAYNPDDAKVYLAYAYYHQKVQEPVAAEAAYHRALDLAPDDGNIHNNYGTFLCGEKRFAEAEHEFLTAIAAPRYNDIANSYENAGQCALEQGDKVLAVKYLQAALAHNPHNLAMRFAIAELHYQLADYPAAKQQLSLYEAVATDTANSLWLGFNIANKQDKPAIAEAYSRQLLAEFPLAIQTQKYIANDY